MTKKNIKIAAVAAVAVAVVYILCNVFITGEKFCDKFNIYSAHTIKVNVSEDIGEEFVCYDLSGEERQQLENWIGNMKLMKVPPKDSWNTASLRHVEILCYWEDGTLRQIITVLGDSYIRTHGMINTYKIL